VDNADYPFVTVYVRVENQAGNLVEGIPQEQFSVSEEGQPVVITAFTPVVVGGISTVLTLDRSSSMEERNKLQGAKDAAVTYIQHIRTQDQVALVVFDDQVEVIHPFTADQDSLIKSVRALRTGDCTAIYDGLYRSAELIEKEAGRRSIILITDGIDCQDIEGVTDQGSKHTLQESIDYVYQTSVPVYVIGLGDRSTNDVRAGINETVLKQIAEATGGKYYYTPHADELAALYRSLAIETQLEYVVTYRSPRPTYDGTRRNIQVDVRGAASASTAYLEQHLLNIRSDLFIGLILFALLVVMLLLPLLIRQVMRPQPRLQPGNVATAYFPPPASPPSVSYAGVPAPGILTCQHCGSTLRPGAKFCSVCGEPTPNRAASASTVCPQCGNPLRPGAKFCGRCGMRM